MCIDVKPEIWIAERDIVAYKVVQARDRKSPVAGFWFHNDGKAWRSWLSDYFSRPSRIPMGAGPRVLEYPKGATVTSKWPGIYLYRDELPARQDAALLRSIERMVIHVLIPTGTEFVCGKWGGNAAICARRVKVLT